jgi:hypothetical protein
MKSNSFKLSVGLVGFLQAKMPASYDPPRALVGFPKNPSNPDHRPDHKPDQDLATKAADPAANRAAWTRNVSPDSRHPLIPPEVRAKIEAVEPEARAKGWPAELLWNNAFWDLPRGLAAVLDDDDEIVEVTPDYIQILKCRRDPLRFPRHTG